jgi:hypothetical protein
MPDNTTEKIAIESNMYESLVLWFMPYTEAEESLLTEGDVHEIKVGIYPSAVTDMSSVRL